MDTLYFAKTAFYSSTNAKILSFVPSQDRRILEWGCSFGNFTATLASKLPKSSIYGVEDDSPRVESIRGKYSPQEYRNVTFEVAQLDEIGEYVKVRHLQLDLIILPFILHRLGNNDTKLSLFKDILNLPASPRVIVTDVFQPENPTEKTLRKFWDERASAIYRNTFWRVFESEMEKDFNIGEAKRIAIQTARREQELELACGKEFSAQDVACLISESALEQIVAAVGFSHIFHEKVDAWGNCIFVIQK